MKYKIKNEQVVFDDHYQMLKADVTYDTFDGDTINTERLAFYRGDSVAILIHEKDTDSILLTKQFRYPTTKHDIGWITEIPAGSLEQDECPLTCIKREVLEEIGYNITQPEQIYNCYNSPGASTEKCTHFFAEVHSRDQIEKGGGLATENEDIKLIKLHVSEIKEFLKTEARDAKTILMLQWFLLR